MKLPKTINPCPIIDALLEIRFSTKIHPNAVFGLIYNVLKDDFTKVDNLPILQLPDVVRATDPNLKFKPHYKISNSNFVVQIGTDVLSISSFPKYVGWDDFSKMIFSVIEKVEEIKIINNVNRLGIRYINFFQNNVFDVINLRTCINEETINYKNTVVRTEIEHEDFISTLQIANNALNKDQFGSVIDIDTYKVTGLERFFTEKEEIINSGHNKEKELFFSLLNEKFLSSLNPEY